MSCASAFTIEVIACIKLNSNLVCKFAWQDLYSTGIQHILSMSVLVTFCRYAGAGLFDSVQSTEPNGMQTPADFSIDRMCNELNYQQCALGVVSLQLERLISSAQDVEGVIDHSGAINV